MNHYLDGAGPSVDNQDASSERSAQTDLIDEEKASQAPSPKPEQVSEHKGVESQKRSAAQPKCTFSGEVPIDLQQFLDSGVHLVECPDCTSTSALSPHKGILHFKPHKRRKTRSTLTEPALGQARNDLGNGERVVPFSVRISPQFTKWE